MAASPPSKPPRPGWRGAPSAIWTLGLVSLFMDVSSEMIHSLLPVFLVGTLGASAVMVGIIEGVGEATGSIVKVFSGWLSDRLGKRKALAVAGYGMGALAKPLFAIAGGPLQVLAARFIDRIGKGVRGAPRDALISDITPEHARGAAFGLRQALDTVGAFAGPLLAIGLMLLLSGDIRMVFWLAVIPALMAVGALAFGVREPDGLVRPERGTPVDWKAAGRLGGAFWVVIAVSVVFYLARFSEAFLILRAQQGGLAAAFTPAVLVAMNVVYAAVAAPAGALSDRVGRRGMLAVSLAVLIAADLVLALWSGLAGAFLGAALWGLHMGLSQGLLSAMVADAAPARLRGTAFGVFGLATGLALLAASTAAGVLWQAFGPAATFGAGAALALAALAGLTLARGRGKKNARR